MQIGKLDTNVASAQLNNLFDIREILKRRGLEVKEYENPSKLLFDPNFQKVDEYYKSYCCNSFRRIISFIANFKDGRDLKSIKDHFHYYEHNKIEENLTQAIEYGMISKKDSNFRSINSNNFGPTLEWFICSILVRELGCIAYWGVNVKDLPYDYDVLLIRDNQLGYIECKSGIINNITEMEIQKFLSRRNQLAPKFSIFLIDGAGKDGLTHLVNWGKKFSSAYRVEIPEVSHTDVSIKIEEYEHFYRLVPINLFFVSAKDDIIGPLQNIFKFLTQVCDSISYGENHGAKESFGLVNEK
ncbi:MAG: hypothetical protein IH886_04395 [Nitrospinae bacterium]|nr:hypothetical protein [Nitrospinota bacterium]